MCRRQDRYEWWNFFQSFNYSGVKLMPDDVLVKLVKLASEGATLFF
jgi:hypothetical protein